MAKKKGRSLTAAERPVRDELRRRMLTRQLFGYCLADKGEVEVWYQRGEAQPGRPWGPPAATWTLEEAKRQLGLDVKPARARTLFAVKSTDLPAGVNPERVVAALRRALEDETAA